MPKCDSIGSYGQKQALWAHVWAENGPKTAETRPDWVYRDRIGVSTRPSYDGVCAGVSTAGVLRWGGSGAPRLLSSTPLDPRGTRPPRVGACIGLMGLPWPWCPSNATNLGGRGRQIFRGHLDLSRFAVVSDEIVCKKRRKNLQYYPYKLLFRAHTVGLF